VSERMVRERLTPTWITIYADLEEENR